VPYLLAIGEHGVLGALKRSPELIQGINLYQGELAHPVVASALGREPDTDLFSRLMAGGVQ
jgi:alanine dehydrogenase